LFPLFPQQQAYRLHRRIVCATILFNKSSLDSKMKVAPLPKVEIGKVRVSVCDVRGLLKQIHCLLSDRFSEPRTIFCVNAHIFNLLYRDPRLKNRLDRAFVTAADGMAIVWAARLLGHKLPSRCNMTEAYHAFLRDTDMPPSRAILIGCSYEEADAAARRANQISSHCIIIEAFSGFLVEPDYRKIFLGHADADFIFLGMGTPKTEFMAEVAAQCCPRAIVWGIGGGTIRIDAGTMEEAPVFLRRLGLQWLYRLLKEPSALWHRYLIGNPVFIARILKVAFLERFSSKP
jgi:N-acetylglucosaminyldiphosphoundecaprenol N-acetyl-beta-D-mannosaminyltransferase